MPIDLPRLRPPSRIRLVDDVYQSLEQAILTGQIKPGDRLIETWIQSQLGVSRTTVREALLKLERQGLVISRPRRGTFVTRLSPEDALNFGIARALLEAFALRIGFGRFDAALFDKLERTIVEMGSCRLPQDVPKLVQLDLVFHQLLVTVGGSQPIVELWSSLSGQIRAMYFTTLMSEHSTIEYIVEFHRQLCTELRSGDPQAAQQAVIRHYVRDSSNTQVLAALATTDTVISALLNRP